MDLEKLQKVIEAIGSGLPPGDDWMPALIVETKEEASVFGFVGNCMENEMGKNTVADAITECIVKSNPDCACFVTTAWTLDFEALGLSEFDVELWKAGAYKISDHPKRIEIVNAYVYAVRGPNKGEALMMGFIQRFPDKGPKIKKWDIMKEGVAAEGRFPEAVKQGFQLAQLKGG